MKKIIFSAVLIGSMLVSAGSVLAAGHGAGMKGYGACDRLRDGSCLNTLSGMNGNGDCDRSYDRLRYQLRDGSCRF